MVGRLEGRKSRHFSGLAELLHISAAAQAGGSCRVPLYVGRDTLVRDYPGRISSRKELTHKPMKPPGDTVSSG